MGLKKNEEIKNIKDESGQYSIRWGGWVEKGFLTLYQTTIYCN